MAASDPTLSAPELNAEARELLDAFANGLTFADLNGYSARECEEFYQTGYELYQSARYADAVTVFRYLVANQHTERRYIHAYACALRMNRDYAQALQLFALATLLDASDPEPPLQIAECFLALGQKTDALAALDMSLALSEGEPRHAQTHERATSIRTLITSAPH